MTVRSLRFGGWEAGRPEKLCGNSCIVSRTVPFSGVGEILSVNNRRKIYNVGLIEVS